MKIALIDLSFLTNWLRHDDSHFPIPVGLLSIATVIKNLGYHIELFQAHDLLPTGDNKTKLEYMADYLAKKKFNIIGFTTRADIQPLVIELARRCKSKQKDVIIVLGGPGVTFLAPDILQVFPFIDIVVRGEGEHTFRELIIAIENNHTLADVDGITYRDNGNIFSTHDRRPILNLDTLPEPAYDLIKMDNLIKSGKFQVEVGRGCPNNCSFCSTKSFWGKKVRMYPPTTVVSRIEKLYKKYGIRTFSLIHDNFLAHKSFVREFCELLIAKKLPIGWYASSSLNFYSSEIFELMYVSGCRGLFFGIETASNRHMHNIKAKFYEPKDICGIMDDVRKRGLRKITRSFIIGFPEETNKDIEVTFQCALENQAGAPIHSNEHTQIHPLTIYPGTVLYDELKDKLHYTGIFGTQADRDVCKIGHAAELCRQYPRLFSAYASYQMVEKQMDIYKIRYLFSKFVKFFPKTLLLLTRKCSLSILQLIIQFNDFLEDNGKDTSLFAMNFSPNSQSETRYILRCIEAFPTFVNHVGVGYDTGFAQLFLEYEMFKLQNQGVNYTDDIWSELDMRFEDDSFFKHVIITPTTTRIVELDYNPDKTFKNWLDSHMECKIREDLRLCFFRSRRAIRQQSPIASVWQLRNKSYRTVPIILRLADGQRTGHEVIEEILKLLGNPPQISSLSQQIAKHIRELLAKGIILLRHEVI